MPKTNIYTSQIIMRSGDDDDCDNDEGSNV